jgi:glycosyltransferase involved in cell wall biosynthesis
MPRVGLYLDTLNVKSIDVRDVDAGNPGMGGTEYMFFLVAAHLARTQDVTLYVTHAGAFPEGIRYVVVDGLAGAAERMAGNGEELLILRESEVKANRKVLAGMPQKVLVWAHNFSGHRTLKTCVATPAIKRYVCVSREQYENLRDEAVFAKADWVYNAVATGCWPADPRPAKADNVFYMGSLTEQKGFHVLARHWPEIARAVPGARLHVVGSGQLYSRAEALGPLGLASREYEQQFAKYLTEHGRLREDIIFHGTLGADKLELLGQAKVAVANPTGIGETFCITALEFALLGVPVVTRNAGGPVNVVVNGETSLLYEHESELPQAVIALLRDEGRRQAMGRKAIQHARSHFDIATVVAKWEKILGEVRAGLPAVPDLAVTGRPKALKEWNRRLKRIPLLGWLPSIDHWAHSLRKKKHSLFDKRFRRLWPE